MTRIEFHSSILILGVALGCLSGCAVMRQAATGARPPNDYGPDAYSQTQIAADRFVVFFMGTWSEEERVADFALMRAAELALAEGFSHFEVLSEAMYIEGVDQGSGGRIPIGPVGVTVTSSSKRFTSRMLVRFLRDAREEPDAVHDAQAVVDDVTMRYGISRNRGGRT